VLDALVEELAAVEHARWAHWQRYVHAQCEHLADGRLVIPAELVQRWEKQIATPYDRLTETEKNSDRAQVERVLPILARYFPMED
jgi:hypothetical protein